MDYSVAAEEFVDGLFTKDAEEQPSDECKPDEVVMELPEWFDEEQFNRGRQFFSDFRFSLSLSMLMGLVSVFAVPSILRILVGSRRSNSVYTSYKRYVSTFLHTITWFEHELKPGSTSWRSLEAVRVRHIKATLASKQKGAGVISQRDVALTQFGFIGFSILKSEVYGIRQLRTGDWEAYNHFWKVIGHMIGLEDKYNICRETMDETREVCKLIQERVFTPCLENVPEYFEHLARMLLDGMWSVNPTVEVDGMLYWCRYLADVPGYIYTETDRIELQRKIKKQLKGRSLDTGVDSKELMSKCYLDGLPAKPPRLLYYHDYDSIDTAPAYKQLSLKAKYKVFFSYLLIKLYSCRLGRYYFNFHFSFSLLLIRYFPYIAFFRFGIKESIINIFAEDPVDDASPKPNAEYYKPRPPLPWYKEILEWLW